MGRQKNSKDEWSIEDNQPTLCQFKKLYTVIIIVMSVQGNNAVVFCRKTKMRVCVAGSQLELNHVLPHNGTCTHDYHQKISTDVKTQVRNEVREIVVVKKKVCVYQFVPLEASKKKKSSVNPPPPLASLTSPLALVTFARRFPSISFPL